MSKLLTIGIPAYKAEAHICDALASIQIQSIRDDISIIIAKDYPSDNYDFGIFEHCNKYVFRFAKNLCFKFSQHSDGNYFVQINEMRLL